MNNKFSFLVLCFFTSQLCPSFVSNKDIPFYSNVPSERLSQGPQLYTSTFFSKTLPVNQDFNRDVVMNPWGEKYDLKDLNLTLQEYAKSKSLPVINYLNSPNLKRFLGTDYTFIVSPEVNRSSQGFTLGFSQAIPDLFSELDRSSDFGRRHHKNLSSLDLIVKAEVAFFNVSSTAKYTVDSFDTGGSPSDDEVLIKTLDSARNKMHDFLLSESGLSSNVSHQQGPGDFFLSLGLRKRTDYFLNFKSLDWTLSLFGTLPSGVKKDPNNSLSIDFGSQGHTFGAAFSLDSELKHGLFAGLDFSLRSGFSSEKKRRIAVGREPSEVSPLLAEKIKVESGNTFIFSPYFKWKDFKEGLDWNVRFVYTHHGEDSWQDLRDDIKLGSFLQSSPLDVDPKGRADRTSWSTRFVNVSASYVPRQRFQFFDNHPEFLVSLDYPFDSERALRNLRFSIGTKFLF